MAAEVEERVIDHPTGAAINDDVRPTLGATAPCDDGEHAGKVRASLDCVPDEFAKARRG